MDGVKRRFHSPRDYLELARSSAATAEQLTALAALPYDFVHLAVAEHPATPEAVLERLLPTAPEKPNDQALLCALAKHPSATPLILRAIADLVPPALHLRNGKRFFEAGIELFKRHDVDVRVLRALLDDARTTTEFRKVAARETTRQDVMELLANDRSEKVRRTIEKRSSN